MAEDISKLIARDRCRLQNPYAHLDGEGDYSALAPVGFDHNGKEPATADLVTQDRLRLENPYAHLNPAGGFSALTQNREDIREIPSALTESYRSLLRSGRTKRNSRDEIENLAVRIQQQLWRDRDQIWPNASESDPISVLDAQMVFQLMGFKYNLKESLGTFYSGGEEIEVAGIIDDSMKEVSISRRFGLEIRNFTLAHELGHALLHDARGLHRDKPLSGPSSTRNQTEIEADKFASAFLMPEKLVKTRFKTFFLTDKFELNEGTRFALMRGQSPLLAHGDISLRNLSRILASTGTFNGVQFFPLSVQFRVSVEAMAIRLEELGLIAQ